MTAGEASKNSKQRREKDMPKLQRISTSPHHRRPNRNEKYAGENEDVPIPRRKTGVIVRRCTGKNHSKKMRQTWDD